MVCIKKQPYIYFVRLTFKNRHFFRYLTCEGRESVKRQANRQCYIRKFQILLFGLPNKELDAVDRLVYDEQLNAFRNQLSSEDATKLDRLLAGECFRGRKKMIRELKFDG